MLAIAGGAVGISGRVSAGAPPHLSSRRRRRRVIENVTIDGSVLLYAAGMTLLTALVFGLIPALQASKPDLHASLKDAARGSGGARASPDAPCPGGSGSSARHSLLALGLLTVRSLQDLLRQDPGFDTSDVLTFQLNLPLTKYPEEASRRLFFERLMDDLRALPGVEAASAVQTLPLAGSNSWRGITVEGIPLEEPEKRQSVGYMQIEDEYFEALDIPVLRGRSFAAADLEEGTNVVAVNQSFVERYWPKGEDPLGRRVRNGWEPPADGEPPPWLTIVGVVADVRHQGFDDRAAARALRSLRQLTGRGMTVVIETPAIRQRFLPRA